MDEENNPVSEISDFRSRVTNWLPSSSETALILERQDGGLTPFNAGRLSSTGHYRRLYSVDLRWHRLAVKLVVKIDETRRDIPVEVELRWRVTDAVEAARQGLRDVPSIVDRFLSANLPPVLSRYTLEDLAATERGIGTRVEALWSHPALEAREFRVTAIPSDKPAQSAATQETRILPARERILEAPDIAITGARSIAGDGKDARRRESRHKRGERGSLQQPATGADEPSRTRNTDLPATIFLTNEAAHEQVEAAVEAMLRSAGLEIYHRDDPVHGSWFRSLKARIRNFARTPLGQDAATLALHAAKNTLVHTQEAEITAKLLENIGPVIDSLQNTDEAVIRVGALLIVKIDGAISVNQLTPAQQQSLYYQPQLLKSPRDILAAIENSPALPGHPAALDDSGTAGRALGNGHEPPPLPPAGD